MPKKQPFTLSLLLITLGGGALLLFYSLAQSDLYFRFGGQVSVLMLGLGILLLILPPKSDGKVPLEEVIKTQPGWWKVIWVVVFVGFLFSTGRLVDVIYAL